MHHPPRPVLDEPALQLAETAQHLIAEQREDALRELLVEKSDPDSVTVNAALFRLCAEALGVLVRGLGRPWQYDDRVWRDRLPDRRPSGRGEWNRFNFVLHASGCLLAGVQLDWSEQQYYLRKPLWPAHLALLALIEDVVVLETELDRTQLWQCVGQALPGHRSKE